MCGRYYIESEDSAEELRQLIRDVQKRAEAAGVSMKVGEIFPSDVVPAVANSRMMHPAAFPMRWGVVPFSEKGLLINARCETAEEKVTFRESARLRRCLLPASRYFEWEKRGGERIQYAIWPEKESLVWLGGLYLPPVEGEIPRFVILTREPAPEIAFIHDRMPVIIPRRARDSWLSADLSLREALPAYEKMAFRAV